MIAPFFFIYGGLSNDNKILNDMYCLNCETFQWRRLFYYEAPPNRLFGGFASTGFAKSYLIGGITFPENLVLNDVWQFSLGYL